MKNYLQSKQEKEEPGVVKYWRKHPKSIEKYQFVYRFLPKDDKKKRADFLDNKAILIYCAIILFVTLVFRFIPKFAPGVLGYASNINVSDLLKYTNKKREENGASNLRLNAKLSSAAEKKAQDMFADGYWAHVAPDGKEPWDFIISEGYDYIYAGENLAKNFSTSKEVVEAWFNSPSHKSNLIGKNYDEVGFAVVNGVMDGYETTLVVQMFGRPRQPSMLADAKEEQVVLEKSQTKEITSVAGVTERTEVPANIPREEQSKPEDTTTVVIATNPQETKAVIDVTKATKTVSIAFGGFVGSLLAVDVLYSRKKGLRKFTGLTLAHITIIGMVIASIWFILKPGLVI